MLIDKLVWFGMRHDRPGNIAAHAVGVPLLFLSAATALSLLGVHVGGLRLTLAEPAELVLAFAWLRLDTRLGAATIAASLPLLFLAGLLSASGWLDGSLAVVAIAILGVACEVGGHQFEGSRPLVRERPEAIVIAPLFLVAQACFLIGLREELALEVDRRVRANLPNTWRVLNP